MQVTFIDPLFTDYDCATPEAQPLRGTQTAIAYLARELAALGVGVTVVNGVTAPRTVAGVRFANVLAADFLNEADCLVVASHADLEAYRGQLGVRKPLALWSHHASDQDGVRPLHTRAVQAGWDAIILISEWQARTYAAVFGLAPERITILRNAASPAALATPIREAWFETGAAPRLCFASLPDRGLEPLLLAYPSIRKAIPDLELSVYCATEEEEDAYLRELTCVLPGARHEGAVSQSELAQAFAGAAALAYPCVWPETSCITAMDAMAAGAGVIATAFCALPETTAGFADLMPMPELRTQLIDGFAALAIRSLTAQRTDPSAAVERRARQVRFVRETYSWHRRAEEWIPVLEKLSAMRA